MQKAVWTRYFDTSVSFYIQEFVTITSRLRDFVNL